MCDLLSRFCRHGVCRIAIMMLLGFAWTGPAVAGAIHDASKSGDLGEVRVLLTGNRALVSSQDAYGRMPLHYAAAMGRVGVVSLLLSRGANVNAKSIPDRETALM